MAKKIFVSELEFDEIKSNLKSFLTSQTEFSDYNFEGSGLAVLLDVLAYNTHYNALYDNMLVNECFLDSATKRDSVVSRAADLGYTPRSAKCSNVSVNLKFTPTSIPEDPPSHIAIPSHSPFKSNTQSSSYTFYNTQSVILKKSGNDYIASDVYLFAGKPSKIAFTYENESTRFVIPNQNCDIDTIKVLVFDSASLNSRNQTFSRSNTIIDVKSDSSVYWIKEIDNFLYEIKFGDGIIGKALQSGNLVVVDYMISYGAESNGIRSIAYSGTKTFSYDGSTTLTVDASTTVNGASYGGAEIESIESIKFNAPRSFTSNNRAVTAEDYRTIILNKFPDAKSVSVWGGEDNYPPEYGKVFICVSQNSGKRLTPSQKLELYNILKTRKVVSITPVILDSEYIDLILNVFVYYNERDTVRSSEDIKQIVMQNLFNYNNETLEQFDGIFRNSKVTKIIDSSERSIVNSNISVKMQRQIVPKYNTTAEYTINLINPIKPGSLSSSGFYIDLDENYYFIEDDSNGALRLFYSNDDNEKTIRYTNIGTINYSKGIIKINGLNIVAVTDSTITFTMEPSSKDVVSALTQVVRIAEDKLNVSVLSDKTSLGDLRAGQNYNFT